MKVLSLKVPEALDRKLTAVVKRRGVRKSAVVRQALEQYLDESGEIRSGSGGSLRTRVPSLHF